MDIIKCSTCGGVTSPSITMDISHANRCKIIIDNVPCYRCADCGEEMYLGKTVERMEIITATLSNDFGAIIYLDYDKCLKSELLYNV